jgi:hypothetical protein
LAPEVEFEDRLRADPGVARPQLLAPGRVRPRGP